MGRYLYSLRWLYRIHVVGGVATLLLFAAGHILEDQPRRLAVSESLSESLSSAGRLQLREGCAIAKWSMCENLT
jgi:hypothetical protein